MRNTSINACIVETLHMRSLAGVRSSESIAIQDSKRGYLRSSIGRFQANRDQGRELSWRVGIASVTKNEGLTRTGLGPGALAPSSFGSKEG
jgi:hypothetical protein